MHKPTIEPTITLEESGNRSIEPYERRNHPAYGLITMTTSRSSKKITLFGSDLGHSEAVRIRVETASLKRDLNHDWIHGEGCILEFEMSHAQFAQFITSQGNGNGTPITLGWTRENGEIPEIKHVKTKHDTFRHEVAEAAKERLDAIQRQIDILGHMIEEGKMPKKDLRELHKELHRHAGQLPGTMQYVVKSAEEALEKATADAKIEVESYIAMSAKRIGLNHIGELAQLENKERP